MIVAMETLSDFGAVDHFAVSTFTTGIFRTWYGMYDLTTAMQLASMLLIFITFCLIIERISRKNANYSTIASNYKPTPVKSLPPISSMACFFVCFLPLFIGFILPILEILNWTLSWNSGFLNKQFFSISINTILLSILSAVLCTFIAMIINFSIRYKNSFTLKFINPFLNIGYAVPGLILAVGIVQLFVFLDNNVLNSFEELKRIREAAPTCFMQSGGAVRVASEYEAMKLSHKYLDIGADVVYGGNWSYKWIRALRDEFVPINSHVGLVPGIATWIGGFKAQGKTADTAIWINEIINPITNKKSVPLFKIGSCFQTVNISDFINLMLKK